jgi:hypothetical protein
MYPHQRIGIAPGFKPLLIASPPSGAKPSTFISVVNESHQGICKRIGIPRRYEHARYTGFDYLGVRAYRRRHNGHRVRQTFQHGHCESLGERRQHQDISGREKARHPFRTDPAREVNPLRNSQGAGHAAEGVDRTAAG